MIKIYKMASKTCIKRKCQRWIGNSCILSTIMTRPAAIEDGTFSNHSEVLSVLIIHQCFQLASANFQSTPVRRPSDQHVVLW